MTAPKVTKSLAKVLSREGKPWRVYLEFRGLTKKGNPSRKFWCAEGVDRHAKVTVTWGKIGSSGQSQAKAYGNPILDSIDEKLRKGYTYGGGTIDKKENLPDADAKPLNLPKEPAEFGCPICADGSCALCSDNGLAKGMIPRDAAWRFLAGRGWESNKVVDFDPDKEGVTWFDPRRSSGDKPNPLSTKKALRLAGHRARAEIDAHDPFTDPDSPLSMIRSLEGPFLTESGDETYKCLDEYKNLVMVVPPNSASEIRESLIMRGILTESAG